MSITIRTGSNTSTSISGGGGSSCRWTHAAPQGYGGNDNSWTKIENGITYQHYFKTCPAEGISETYWVRERQPGPIARLLEDTVTARLAPPTFGSAPPATSNIVKYDMWMWAEPTDFTTISATATIAGPTGPLTATVTATPLRLVFEPGEPDSRPVVCAWPGRHWFPSDGESDSTCTYSYTHASSITPNGTFPARWSTIWDVSWSASTGATGQLDPTYRTTTDITVLEVQALVTE